MRRIVLQGLPNADARACIAPENTYCLEQRTLLCLFPSDSTTILNISVHPNSGRAANEDVCAIMSFIVFSTLVFMMWRCVKL